MDAEKLVKKAKKGNKQAFLQLIEAEQARLYRTAFLYAKNQEDALDIVQETIYKAFISIETIRDPRYFTTWLIRILIHSALDFLKKKQKVIPLEQDSFSKMPAKEIVIEDKMDLYDAIDKLNERHKTIIILRYYQDLTVAEIADIVGIPEGTVKSNLHRALQLLRLEVKEGCINE